VIDDTVERDRDSFIEVGEHTADGVGSIVLDEHERRTVVDHTRA